MLSYPEIGFTLTAIGSSLYLLYKQRALKGLSLPPSPAGSYPIVGHALVLPTKDEHLTYAQWCKELNSDIISLTALGQTIIIINSVEVAKKLLDQRSTIYSSRPYLRAICDPDLLAWGDNIAIMPYGPEWKKQRRIMHEALKPSVNIHNSVLFERETHGLLKRLLMSPESFEKEFRRTVAAEILSSVYGYTVKDTNDTLVRDSAALVENFTIAAIPANFLVNFVPWLKYIPAWFPGAQWKRNIIEWRQLKEHVMNDPYEWAKAQIASGFAAPSIVQSHLASVEDSPKINITDEEESLRRVGVSLFGAAADTSHASLMSFVLAMIQHPHVQSRAQQEIDRVTHCERLPTMEDRDSMPYIRCIVQEVLRWQPPLPLGVPRATSEADEYGGYYIPKGSVVITNSWAMSRDTSMYTSPEAFNPDRFRVSDAPSTSSFGFGRRSCPGSHYAEASLFILFASILAVFDLTPKINPVTGQAEMPEGKVAVHALVSRIVPFECTIKPRSNVHKELIESTS
ncbi:O-methylsterigmatocystin oxidoreductase Short=OMST oxidoreductase [Rhizoctonia solani AG-1 IB]|uniref:O-methylsterigmatocystin oxidoreductase Short=OMST oxidoreductase n=2 Tax=Thanatephorus cucumeris (strain AG1-IB / isolate 7/3/14) TaxID=1108050 RepID=M5BUX5_THACB|nr:O-methylsterigmatocystin oxidoreductase Short=OMST oxidoreductase [Rhizoctonia solani AG-1 IB]